MHDALTDKLNQLEQKFAATGQDMAAYLDGLLQADYLTYWDYIHLETLLTLQKPKTAYPDELIFVTYHQITELYFKLILHEITQIADAEPLTVLFFTNRIRRINQYFNLLEQSFGVLITGMDRDQFLKFRMALLPTSGFQSVQFREIEITSTDLSNLLTPMQSHPEATTIAELYQSMYWKQGATDLLTQQKSFTLNQFDQHYSSQLIRLAETYRSKNLYQCYKRLNERGLATSDLVAALRNYDWTVNVRWKLTHLRSAVQHLRKEQGEVKATGGTNWQTYLPPQQQQRVFFPSLWSAEELQTWGQSMHAPGSQTDGQTG